MPLTSLDREEQLKAGKGKGEIKEEDHMCVCDPAKLQFIRHVGWWPPEYILYLQGAYFWNSAMLIFVMIICFYSEWSRETSQRSYPGDGLLVVTSLIGQPVWL